MRRRNGHWLDIIQIVLSLVIIGTALLLIFDWKTYEICFCIVFGLAAVLFALLGISAMIGTRKKLRFGFALLYFLVTTLMIGLFTGSLLAILNV